MKRETFERFALRAVGQVAETMDMSELAENWNEYLECVNRNDEIGWVIDKVDTIEEYISEHPYFIEDLVKSGQTVVFRDMIGRFAFTRFVPEKDGGKYMCFNWDRDDLVAAMKRNSVEIAERVLAYPHGFSSRLYEVLAIPVLTDSGVMKAVNPVRDMAGEYWRDGEYCSVK